MQYEGHCTFLLLESHRRRLKFSKPEISSFREQYEELTFPTFRSYIQLLKNKRTFFFFFYLLQIQKRLQDFSGSIFSKVRFRDKDNTVKFILFTCPRLVSEHLHFIENSLPFVVLVGEDRRSDQRSPWDLVTGTQQ